ncbi:MAG: hypothetical protein GY705_10690 [Bacteroidetes bacterium]|nr:hypothetical protein [Bacteroidota bacterium]
MRSYFFSFMLIIFAWMQACSPHSKTHEQVVNESDKINLEIQTALDELNPKLESLIQLRNSISVQGRALSDTEIKFVDKVETIMGGFDSWKEKYFEAQVMVDQLRSPDINKKVAAKNVLQLMQDAKISILEIQQSVEKVNEMSLKL